MSKIFGGSKQKSQSTSSSQQTSSSSNQAFPWLQQNFGQGAAQSFNQGTSALNNLLGQGFDGYKDNIAYDFQQDQGRGSILGNLAGRGALQSGAALKGLTQYSNNLASTTYDNYLNKLLQQAQLGAGAGQLISGAGGVSQSTGSSTSQSTGSGSSNQGIGGFLGSMMGSIAASDRRLKKNIHKIGMYGKFNLYQYRYINGQGPYIGVMADEVRDNYPEALGPEIGGYMTVDYDKLKEVA